MTPLIEFRDLGKSFPGVQALKGVSFSIGYPDRGDVHALVGENGAGKSTLMNILDGEYAPDGGKLLLEGKETRIPNPHAARRLGIGVVYQELRLCPNLTVTENIFLGREREAGGGKVRWGLMRNASAALLHRLGSPVSPDSLVRTLTVANQQVVEIARALSLNTRILIMDEPTSALSLKESEALFKTIRELRAGGVTIIYISHRMEEIFAIADRISVLRDGAYHGTFDREEATPDRIVSLIAGRELTSELGSGRKAQICVCGPATAEKKAVLSVRNLSRPGCFEEVSFDLYEREILGIYGLQGAGRTELLETLFGLASKWTGEVTAFGRPIRNANAAEAIRNGFAMVPENRRDSGIFPRMTILENVNSANPKTMSGAFGVLRRNKMREVFKDSQRSLSIKTSSERQLVRNLSGGNQQKVVIARWLAAGPRILLVDEPTRGIDVGAKSEIFSIIKNLRDQGLSVIIVSSELAEIVSESDRVLVMRHGKLVTCLEDGDICREGIMRHAL
ncbi:MAG: sugar ABC transporter ATP-binding protein [Planctomycetota bacterium]|nr:sugar ABC transporter ATP-binding protein [Planctomycetota bacterium]